MVSTSHFEWLICTTWKIIWYRIRWEKMSLWVTTIWVRGTWLWVRSPTTKGAETFVPTSARHYRLRLVIQEHMLVLSLPDFILPLTWDHKAPTRSHGINRHVDSASRSRPRLWRPYLRFPLIYSCHNGRRNAAHQNRWPRHNIWPSASCIRLDAMT